MILLADAHVLLWALAAPEEMTPEARSALSTPQNEVLVSAATIWEIAIKRARGRLRAPATLLPGIEQLGFIVVPVTGGDAERAASLPTHHRDPFDRMVIAQAIRLDAVVVSRDRDFASYDVPLLRA